MDLVTAQCSDDGTDRNDSRLRYGLRVGRDSSVGIARYSDSLRAGRSGARSPVKGSYSAPVQTGPGAHPISYSVGAGSFPGVKRPGRGVDRPTHLAPKLKKE